MPVNLKCLKDWGCFQNTNDGCLFYLLCFPSQQEKLEEMGEKRPPGSSDSGVPAAGAVGGDVDVVGRKAARTVEWLVTLSTKVQWLSK